MLSPWLPTVMFAADRPLIPTSSIVEALDAYEDAASGAIITDLTTGANLLSKAGRDPSALVWGLGPQMQRHLSELWRSGYRLGEAHGIAEMKAATPEEYRFNLDPFTMSAIAALLTSEPTAIIPLNIEQAIAQRVLAIAGKYSKEILAKIKVHILGAAAGTVDLKAAIAKELSIGKVRAETIARNEMTYAYNVARVKAFQQSNLVTHTRFISILDTRTTPICRSRNGMLIPMSNLAAIESNRPPLHHRCRSLLSPVMPAINSDHQAWVDDPKRDWASLKLEPLSEGWGG